jgi:hypothetical protein
MSAADYFNIQNKALGFDYYEDEQYKTGNPYGHPELQTINAPEYQIPDESLVTPEPSTPSEPIVEQDTDLIKNIGIGVGTTLLLAGAVLAGPRIVNVARQGLARFGGRGTRGGRFLERAIGRGQATGMVGRERIIEEAIRPTGPFQAMESRLVREGQKIGAADVEFMRTQRNDWSLYNTFNRELDEIEATLPSNRITGFHP